MAIVFPHTITEIDKRIEKLEEEVKSLYEKGNEAYSGGDGWHSAGFRFLEQHRIAQEETLRVLKIEQKAAKPAHIPSDSRKVQFGHVVTVIDSATGDRTKFHICSSLDASVLPGLRETLDERLLSVETKLGKKLLGKEIGAQVSIGNSIVEIESISISPLIKDMNEESVSS